jgi:hypothetical protein
MRTYLYYDAVKIDGPKKKILEFNETDKFMDDKDLKVFNGLCEVLGNKDKYFTTDIRKSYLSYQLLRFSQSLICTEYS